MNSDSVKVIKQSRWSPPPSSPMKGLLPARVVMWEDKRGNYVTHDEINNDGKLYFIAGHYDMSKEAAEVDFIKRCRVLGVGCDT